MKKLITILGPTASGKTPLAVALAERVDGEIISADSRQVYRRMDIGTGKDLREYGNVPFHLIDICEPGTKYNLFQYQKDFFDVYNDVIERGRQPILCGGTGLYVEAIVRNYNISEVPQNPELRRQLEGKPLSELTQMLRELKRKYGTHMHNITDVDTAQRAIRAIEIETSQQDNVLATRHPAVSSVIFGVSIPRELRREKITRRLKARLDEGMVDEIRALLDSGVEADDLIYYGLEYKYVTEYVIGRLTFDEMYRQLEIAIHQFAKRQMTWFRGMERRGLTIKWIDGTLPMDRRVEQIIQQL